MQELTDIDLGFDEFVRVCDSEKDWVLALIDEDVIRVEGNPETAHFSGWQVSRVRRAMRLHRDFSATPPAAALILELLDEVEALRRQLPRE